MKIELSNEQMRMFVEIVQMVALLDEAVQRYIAEFYSLCNDEAVIGKMMNKIKGLESACDAVQKIIKKSSSINKPKIEGMKQKYHEIKSIRNYIAHDRQLLVVTRLKTVFADTGLFLDDECSEIRDMPIEKLYERACSLFDDFGDFLGQLYYEPDEEEYQRERRFNLYGE